MTILKLKPACKDYIWGGNRLKDEFGFQYDGEVLAEAWMLSAHPDGPSTIINGPYAGKTLIEYLNEEGMEVLGTNCRRFREFPILTKFIDARNNLSIQVHPDNAYALHHEGQYGKTEMWYVLDAEPGAFLYYGFKKKISKEEFEERIRNNTLLDVLYALPVHKGDVVFIPSGTLHAIGKGILIAEIQQNSNVTYRIYDYGRVGRDGKPRQLHITQAVAVTKLEPAEKPVNQYPHLGDCDYFTVDKLDLDGVLTRRMQGNVGKESFLSILILDGEGTISCRGEKVSYHKGDSIFLPADSGNWEIEGSCDALLTTIREKANPIRVGINIGSKLVQIGIVNDHNEIIGSRSYNTEAETRTAEEIIDTAANETLKLLQEKEIPLDECIGVGVGVPGTIDRRNGRVVYSNNIGWHNVALSERLGRVIPCPVRIANDADCAALGEKVSGTGRDYSDVAMFTFGNGVGGGIIINGEVFEGGMMGGAEIGHTVIKANGRPCTCGRRGCLEAYASVPALLQSAREAAHHDVALEEIFASAEKGDPLMSAVVDEYIEMVGTGMVNIVNLFRPQLIIIGGQISAYAGFMIPELKKMLAKEVFGRENSGIPEIGVAKLGNEAGMIGAANL